MYIPRIGTIATLILITISASLSAETIKVPRCFIKLIDEAHIAAQESGLLTQVFVTDGTPVFKDDKLAQVDDTLAILQKNVAMAELKVATKESENYISVKYAKATADMALREVQRIEEANQNIRAVAQSDVDKAILALKEANTYIEKALFDLDVKKEEVKVKHASLDAAQEHIDRRTIYAPWDGAVDRIIRHQGDWVEPGNPILHLIRMDKLRVQCLINRDEYNQSDVLGKEVLVTVRLARNQTETFNGKVTGISPMVQADNHYQIWAEITNRQFNGNGYWILRDGMTASMEIKVK